MVTVTGLIFCSFFSSSPEQVPAEMDRILNETQAVKTNFSAMIKTYQQLLMADHIVFDLLDFFTKLDTTPGLNKSLALVKMTEILSHATQTVQSLHDREVGVLCVLKGLGLRSVLTLCGLCSLHDEPTVHHSVTGTRYHRYCTTIYICPRHSRLE